MRLWSHVSLFQEHDNEAEALVSGHMINYDDDDLDIGKLSSGKTIIYVYLHVKTLC